jgi:GxxExxY protein
MKITKSYLRDLTYKINGAAIEVHKRLGPGLLESIYHECLKHELTLRGISFISEMQVPVNYKEISLLTKLRCDLFVENIIVVDLKAAKEVEPIEEARLMSYMQLLKSPKGIIYNFNVINLYHEGQKTYVNQFFENLDD